jgi:hypothetical protein
MVNSGKCRYHRRMVGPTGPRPSTAHGPSRGVAPPILLYVSRVPSTIGGIDELGLRREVAAREEADNDRSATKQCELPHLLPP